MYSTRFAHMFSVSYAVDKIIRNFSTRSIRRQLHTAHKHTHSNRWDLRWSSEDRLAYIIQSRTNRFRWDFDYGYIFSQDRAELIRNQISDCSLFCCCPKWRNSILIMAFVYSCQSLGIILLPFVISQIVWTASIVTWASDRHCAYFVSWLNEHAQTYFRNSNLITFGG